MSKAPPPSLAATLMQSPGFLAIASIGAALGLYGGRELLMASDGIAVAASGVLLGLGIGGLLLRRLALAPSSTVEPRVVEELTKERNEIAEEYRQLTKNLPAAVTVRTPGGTLTFCSPYTEVLTGYALNEILSAQGDFFLSIIHEEDRERYLHALKYGSEGERFNYRYRIVHRSGIELWVETRTHPIFNEQGELTALLSITLDVDLAVRYQRQVELKNVELQEVTYMVSHDLKSPIVTLKGMIDILEQDYRSTLGADGQEIVAHIKGAAQRLDQLVHSVLEYARLGNEEVRQENIPLIPLLNEIILDLTPQIDQVRGTVAIPKGDEVVQGDRIKLYRVFNNLISNAIKYHEPSRPLQINLSVSPLRGNRYLMVSIADNGMGIPASKLESIFRPFQRARTQRADGTVIEGTGIGLASVKKLLDRMGGEVAIESVEGEGTTVRVTVRRALEE